MRITRKTCCHVIAVLVLLTLFCGPTAASANLEGRLVTDLGGRTVVIPEQIDRLVALGPGALRLITYLQALDKVVGIEQIERQELPFYFRPYSVVAAKQLAHRHIVAPGGPGKLPDMEQLIACRPQVIICIGLDPMQVENLQQKTRIPTIMVTYGELGVLRQEVIQSLRLLGTILGKEDRADELITFIEMVQKELHDRVKSVTQQEKPTVYFGGIAYKGARGLTSTEANYLPGSMVKARNVVDAAKHDSHLFIDPEQLICWNPEVIFFDITSAPVIMPDFNRNSSFYHLLKAVKNGRVFTLLPYNQYNTNIEIALINAFFIGKTLYPFQFADITMDEKRSQIFQFFLGNPGPVNLPVDPSFQLTRFGFANN
ncbi:MAG: iron ABC transporter substrate-binding protein [Deltaproteobacteria bacterium]|nr:iron ABC transporter substrate-binding protein [Candidatus Anaeroferrophillus wilburensis]MBN2887770.1 iron ABC transporter substrate-binding protein [Deltaproteobacteria bacterium]